MPWTITMKSTMHRAVWVTVAIMATMAAATAASGEGEAGRGAAEIDISKGLVSFEVATNVFGTSVRGKSAALTGFARATASAAGLRIEDIEASVPVSSLETGIRLRDTHMRKLVFQGADGQLPDLRFSAAAATCLPDKPGEDYACGASGQLTVRGVTRPFAMSLRVTHGEGDAFRVSGSGTVSLADYAIEAPSQFGVRTGDAVAIRIDFKAHAAKALTPSRR